MPQSTDKRAAQNIFSERVPSPAVQNEMVRARRAEAGLPENPEVPNKFNSPYTTGPGSTTPEGQQIIEAQAPPPLESEEQAQRLKAILLERGKETIGEDKWNRHMTQLRTWRASNPPVPPELTPEEVFDRDFVDKTPQRSSAVEQATRQGSNRLFPGGVAGVTGVQPPAPEDDSREAVIRREEEQGLDTLSGFGNIAKVVGLATEFNSPRARVSYIDAVVRDNLEAAGINIPEGMPALVANENLGELMFMKPTEDGQVRWTLADSEVMRFSDFGAVADLPELLSAVGAAAGGGTRPGSPRSVANKLFGSSKHPFTSELLGDFGGRRVGVMAEYLINSGDVTPEEYQAALSNASMQSVFDTVVGRTINRVGSRIFGGKKAGVKVGDNEDLAQIDRNIQESADTMDQVNRLSGGRQAITAAEASDSTRALQEQSARETTLPSKARNVVEADRVQNVRNLRVANNRIAANADPASAPNYDPHGVVKDLNQQRKAFGKVQVAGDVSRGGNVTYSYVGDVADESNVLLSGDQVKTGVTVNVDHTNQTVTLTDIVAGKRSPGTSAAMIDHIIQDTADYGYTLKTSTSLSQDARGLIKTLKDSGFVFSENVDGSLTVAAMPGEIVASPNVATANFEQTVLESELEDMMAVLPAAQQFAADANNKVNGTIGWSNQRQSSKYTVENKSNSTLSQQIRKLQNRIANTLTGVEASQADKQLATIIRREVDDEGETILSGLAGEELDLGNLLTAREKLATVAAETGDAELARTVETIDNLMNSGTIWTAKGNPIAASTRGAINTAVKEARVAQGHVDRAAASINANAMFKQNANGEFVNTSLKSMKSLMANDARFVTHMKPILDENPAIKASAESALNQIYRDEVMEGGWTRAKHNNWFAKYGTSAKTVMGDQGAQELARYELQASGKGLWTRRVERSKAALARMQDRSGLPADKLNPKNLLDSFNKMGRGQARQFMKDVEIYDPQMAARIRGTSIEQTRQNLDKLFFNTDAGVDKLRPANKLKEWFGANQDVLREVHGEQYVTDLQSIVNAHLLDGRRTRVRGIRPETQGDVLRVTRSLLGPLSRPQRQLTAASYVLQRRLAKKVMQVYSDPEALRALNGAKGLSARGEQGMAVLVRLGIFEAAGIQNDRNGVPDPQQVEEFYSWLDETHRRGMEDASVEQN